MYSPLLESARHTTIQEQFIDVLSKNNGTTLYVNDAKMLTPDITTDDAIVHVIDKVLIPLGGKQLEIQLHKNKQKLYLHKQTRALGTRLKKRSYIECFDIFS